MGNNTVAMFLNDCADIMDHRPDDVIQTLSRCLAGGQGEKHGPASSASTAVSQSVRRSLPMPSQAMMMAIRYPGTSPNSPRSCRLMVFSGLPVRRARERWVNRASFARICHGSPCIRGRVAASLSAVQPFNATLIFPLASVYVTYNIRQVDNGGKA